MRTYRCYILDGVEEPRYEVHCIEYQSVMVDIITRNSVIKLHDLAKITGVIERNYKLTKCDYYDVTLDYNSNFIQFL